MKLASVTIYSKLLHFNLCTFTKKEVKIITTAEQAADKNFLSKENIMSSNPTVAQLVAKAQTLSNLPEADIRTLLKIHNVRSFGKCSQIFSGLVLLPVTEVVSEEVVDEAAISDQGNLAKDAEHSDGEIIMTTQTQKAANQKAAKSPRAAKKPGFEKKGRVARTPTIHTEGPRGFRFGDVWNNSVIEGAGVALQASNYNKLLKHAETVGAKIADGAAPDKIAKAIAAKISN